MCVCMSECMFKPRCVTIDYIGANNLLNSTQQQSAESNYPKDDNDTIEMQFFVDHYVH